MLDFIIVGRGLAATVLMHEFRRSGISFHTVGDPGLSACSRVAPGIYNPIVFKRMTRSWMAGELLPHLEIFYKTCEKMLGTPLLTQRTIVKPFTEDQEKKLWIKKADTELRQFIDPEIHKDGGENFTGLNIRNGYGIVNRGGNLDVATFLESSGHYFKENVTEKKFDHRELQQDKDHVAYGEVKARNIIFCEGYLVKDNPWFSWIPLKPAKGEVLSIRPEGIELEKKVFAKDGFLMDVAPGEFRLGATYAWQGLNDAPTVAGRAELEAKMVKMSPCAYKIIRHEAGVRPSSADRRPIIGRHPRFSNLFVFNGLGAKGVMLAPFFAGKFVLFYLKKEALQQEVNVERFYPLYDN